MIALERLAIARVHFAALAEQVRHLYQLVQVDIIHRPERHTRLSSAHILHITTTTQLATARRLSLANPEDFTSTLSNRMVRRNDQSHPTECFPPHHRRRQAAIITYTQMAEIRRRLHLLPIKSIIGVAETVRW